MKIGTVVVALGLVMGVLGPGTVSYAQDVEMGSKVFKKCMACHAIDEKNKIGPSLKGVVGRKAATVEGFKYSDAMLAKGAEGVVWDEATLAAYLPDPKAFVPGTKMTFAGLKKPEEVADIIAFLKTKGM